MHTGISTRVFSDLVSLPSAVHGGVLLVILLFDSIPSRAALPATFMQTQRARYECSALAFSAPCIGDAPGDQSKPGWSSYGYAGKS